MITRCKIVGKTIYFCEKLENKWRNVVRLTLVFWLLPWNFFLWVMVNNFFPQNIKEDGWHILMYSQKWKWDEEHLTTSLNLFSIFLPKLVFLIILSYCYLMEPNILKINSRVTVVSAITIRTTTAIPNVHNIYQDTKTLGLYNMIVQNY